MDLFQSTWLRGKQVFAYPLVYVAASSLDEANVIAGPNRGNQAMYLELTMDAAEALSRLDLWADVEGVARMERGD
jgi:hypothetical protein